MPNLRTLSCLLLVLMGGASARGDAARPNIVFILADDLGWGDVGWHGSRIRTPQLDQLARDGVRLEQHYVAPVCSPTRTGLMTGRFWSRFGVTNPQNERALPWDTPTLPRALQAGGYATALTGKWHLGSKPEWGPLKFGFDHGYGSLAGGCEPWEHFYKTGPYTRTWHRNGELIEEEGHITDLIAREAVRWLEARGDQPFFLYVPFTAPHLPVGEPEQWLEPYADIEDPAKRQYAACVTHMDDAVGRIVATLERLGKLRDTLIVFSSDNGAAVGSKNDDRQYPHGANYTPGGAHGSSEPWRGAKGTVYEGGIRVPALIHWPARLSAGECQAPLHIVDWMPTLCGVAGVAGAERVDWDGQDVLPVIEGRRSAEPRTLYWAGPGSRSTALRHGDWKLVVTRANNRERNELFDLAADPREQHDLSESRREQLQVLLDRLTEIRAADNSSRVNSDN